MSDLLGQFNQVTLVVISSHSYSDIIVPFGPDPLGWWINLKERYGSGTGLYAATHPDIGNYFQLTTGQVITNDPTYTTTVTADNLVRELLNNQNTWKAYAEARPSQGYAGADVGNYVRRQDPLSFFSDVLDGGTQQANLVDQDQWLIDIENNEVPDFAYLVPSTLNNGFSGPLLNIHEWGCRILSPYVLSSFFQDNGLLICVFDQGHSGDNRNGGGLVPFLICSPLAKTKFISTDTWGHESILRLILQALGSQNYPGAASTANDMDQFFNLHRSPPTPPPTISTPRGIFGLLGLDVSLPGGLITNANCDGLAVRTLWSSVQPTSSAPDFSYIDGMVTAAAAQGKTISISVRPGIGGTPSWATSNYFTRHDGKMQPIPWDDTYLANWTAFIAALGAKYGNNATVSHVKVTGVNMDTQETALYNGDTRDIVNSDSTPTWVSVGYTPQKVKTAFETIMAAYAAAFPNKMWVMMTYPHSFPNIDNSGVVLSPLSTALPVTGGKLHTITWTGALDEFAVRYPKNFGIQNNGLSDFFVWPEVYNRAANSPRGYQMLMNVTGDSTFAMNNGVHVPPGPPATVPDILAGAISLGVSPGLSQFQEIYSSDILNAAMVSVLTAGRASILGVP